MDNKEECKLKRSRPWVLALVLALTLALGLSGGALAAEGEAPAEEDGVYVLMNIPYGDFYANENAVDAITSATLNGKARNVNVNGASYHQSEEAVTSEGIAGVMYPVFAAKSDLAALGGTEITDEAYLTYEMTARGQTSTVELRGVEALQEAPSYSYYVLSEEPVSSKKLTVEEGKAVFAAADGSAVTGEAAGEVTVGARHADIEIKLSGVEVEAKNVSAVVITAGEERYALHHVVNIWRGTEIGWNLSDLDLGGKTVTNVRYYLKDGSIKDYATELNISQAGYVLMNIPYEAFYAAELGENGSFDAVSGATLKYANSGIAGGSYHETDAAEGAEVEALGATFPVFVPDMSLLDESLQVTDETVKTIGIVSGREKTITPTEVSGKDALFCAPSYSWYALAEKPARYKALSAAEEGFAFGAVSGRASAVENVTATASYYSHHGNYIEARLNGIAIEEPVNGVVVTFADGSETALPVIQGFWQKTQLGWPTASAAGKTVQSVKFITAQNVYTCAVGLPIRQELSAVSAAFASATSLKIEGLPADAENPVATVKTRVGRGETATVIAENVPVVNGVVTTAEAAESGKTYAVTVVTDNYADQSATAEYTAEPTRPTEPIVVIMPTEPEKKLFEDVKDESAYYFAPVYWAVEKGVAAGRSETVFDPAGSATRAEMLTFLWRAAGSPNSSAAIPFTDVESAGYYETAVRWAWENGVTLGVDATHYAPDATVTRGQVLTFLWRALKIGAVSGENVFEDVAEGDYFYAPVLWAVGEKLTTGADATHFAPMDACKRADIVTFLYRFYSK